MSKYSWPWLKVGDKVKLKDYSRYEFPLVDNQIAVITEISGEDVYCTWPDSDNYDLKVKNASNLAVHKTDDGGYLFGAYLVDDMGNPIQSRGEMRVQKSLGKWDI